MTDETMPATAAPSDRMTEIDDLARYLGGSLTGPNAFLADLLRMIDKYSGDITREERLARAWPELHRIWQVWDGFEVPPTRSELSDELAWQSIRGAL